MKIIITDMVMKSNRGTLLILRRESFKQKFIGAPRRVSVTIAAVF